MIKLLLLSHGDLARAMKGSCEMIMSEVPFLDYLCLDVDRGNEYFKQQLMNLLQQRNREDKFLFMCDIYHGTPFNNVLFVLAELKDIEYKLITGVNLPMLLEICSACKYSATGLDELVNIGLNFGKQGIQQYIEKCIIEEVL